MAMVSLLIRVTIVEWAARMIVCVPAFWEKAGLIDEICDRVVSGLTMTWQSRPHDGNRVDGGGMGILVALTLMMDIAAVWSMTALVWSVTALMLSRLRFSAMIKVKKANADHDNVLTCVTTRQATTTRTDLVVLVVKILLMLMKILKQATPTMVVMKIDGINEIDLRLLLMNIAHVTTHQKQHSSGGNDD
eukprot:scaffold30329_cov13-Prasinocladus_malaysianus.AAC.1